MSHLTQEEQQRKVLELKKLLENAKRFHIENGDKDYNPHLIECFNRTSELASEIEARTEDNASEETNEVTKSPSKVVTVLKYGLGIAVLSGVGILGYVGYNKYLK